MTSTLVSWEVNIIEPEAATNLVTDPSFVQTGITNYSGLGTIAQSSEQMRRGVYCAKVTPGAASSDSYIYTSVAMSAGTEYSFSADIFEATAGYSFTISIREPGGTVLGSTSFVSNGHWQRYSVTATSASSDSNSLIIERTPDQGSAEAWYTDGWLCKVGADNNYFDGDSTDPYLDFAVYGWNGTPHASTSWRSAKTRSGGTLLDLSDYAKVLSIQGLGMTGFVTNVSGLALGGEMYQNTHANARPFTFICESHIAPTAAYGTLQRKFAALEKAVNPKRMSIDQPLRLMIVGRDSAGTEASDRVIIPCVYEGGLEGDWQNKTPKFSLSFRQFDALIPADGYICTSLQASTSVNGGSTASILFLNLDTGGTTAIISIGDNPGQYINGLLYDNSGGFYVYGNYVNYGDTDGDYITYRNSAGSVSSLGSGGAGEIHSAALGLDGKIYVAGAGANIGGVAAADYAAYWDTSWHAMEGGFNGAMRAICVDGLGNIYMGGDATTAVTGSLAVNYIAKWNGSAWAAIGGATKGVGNSVRTLIALPDNRIVLGGLFSSAGGDADIDYLAIYDPTADAFSAIGTVPDGPVYRLLYDRQKGLLYVFGSFTTIGGISAPYAAFWDGNNWNPMPGVSSINYSPSLGDDGVFYAYGTFVLSGITYTNVIGAWAGSGWRIQEYDNNRVFTAISYRSLTNEIGLLGYTGTSDPVTYTIPAVSTITNSTEGDLYPWLVLSNTGYYVYSLWNRTTGDRIYLNGLTVGAGESIFIAFTQYGYSVISNLRGDLRSAVQSGSTPTFRLAPGTNYVSCFVYPSPTAAITIPIYTQAGSYLSLNGTVYE